MHVHDDLEAWPEVHVDEVDIRIGDRDFAALELKGELLIEPDTQEDAEAIGRVLD